MRQFSRRKLLAAMGALPVAGLVAACTATATTAPTSPTTADTAAAAEGEAVPQVAAEGSIKLLYWSHDFAERVTLDEKYIEKFAEVHPEIAVEYVAAGDYDMKLRTALAAGTGPDLFTQWNGEIGQFHLSGMLTPVETTAFGVDSQQDLMDEYESPETLLAGCMFEGKLFGIPNEVSTYGCFLNRTLWEEAGLDPETDYSGLWDEFPGFMEQLTVRDASGNVSQRGWDFCWSTADYKYETLVCMAQQLGAMPVDQDAYTADLESEEVVYVMQYLADWVNKHRLGGPGYQISRDAFMAGTLATEGTYGSWGIPGMNEAGIDFVLHKLPTFRDATSPNYFDTYAYFHMVNSRATADAKKAGWQLAYFLSQYPEDYLANAGLLQPKKVLTASSTFTDDPYLGTFLEMMQVNYYLPLVAGFWECCEAVGRAVDRCTTEGIAPSESLATAQAEVTDILTNAKAAAQGA